jgi:hypothetical protein
MFVALFFHGEFRRVPWLQTRIRTLRDEENHRVLSTRILLWVDGFSVVSDTRYDFLGISFVPTVTISDSRFGQSVSNSFCRDGLFDSSFSMLVRRSVVFCGASVSPIVTDADAGYHRAPAMLPAFIVGHTIF